MSVIHSTELRMWLGVTVLISLAVCLAVEEVTDEGILCSKYQQAFNHSCYEFVRLQQTFTSAQRWCERGGGHLVFIQNEDTQEFLQKHIAEDQEWWIGLISNSLLNETTDGSITWLDTSNISYSKWYKDQPSPFSSACGYILKNAKYQWGVTENCSQEFYFICEFDSGQSIACDSYNATVQCGSGEVIQVEESFYGRKTPHYCVPETPLQFETDEGCSWISVKDEVAGQCHGLQACQVAADGTFFGDPCPALGSYLSIQYHCKEGLQLVMTDTCFVFENITVTLNWLLSPYSGNLSCTISTGDGYTIDPYYPLTLVSNLTYRYSSAGEFTVFVECTTSEWHVMAQRQVTVQDQVDQLSISGCYSQYETGNSSHCRTLYGEVLWIQVQLSGGNGVTYSIFADNMTLTESSAEEGLVPHNLTLNSASQKLIGPGMHWLEIRASGNTTASEISRSIAVHLIEPVSGIQAAVASHTLQLGEDLEVNVSVSHGAPEQLMFEVIGSNQTHCHRADSPRGELQTYSVPAPSEGTAQGKTFQEKPFSSGHPSETPLKTLNRKEGSFLYKLYIIPQTCWTEPMLLLTGPLPSLGTFQVKVVAMNAFSNVSLDLGFVTVLANGSHKKGNGINLTLLVLTTYSAEEEGIYKTNIRKKNDHRIYIKPSRHVDPFTTVTLGWPDNNNNSSFLWTCGACWPAWNECVKQQIIQINQSKVQIPPSCLPPPKSAVTVRIMVQSHGSEERQDEQCLYVTAKQELQLEIRCEANCKPVNVSDEVVLSVSGQEDSHTISYDWYLDNTFINKSTTLPPACGLIGFQQNSLNLLQSNTSVLRIPSSFLQTQGEAFQIKVRGRGTALADAPLSPVRGTALADAPLSPVPGMTQRGYGEGSFLVSTVPPPDRPACAVSPGHGSALTAFRVSCSAPGSERSGRSSPSRQLTYCFYETPRGVSVVSDPFFPISDSLLDCSPDPELFPVYLPLGEEENNFILHVTIIVSNNFGDRVQTNASVKVGPADTMDGNLTLQAVISEKANTILKDGNNSMSLFQLYKSVTSVLNQQIQEESFNMSLQTNTRKELRGLMLTTLSVVNITSMQTALKMSEVLKEITYRSEELSVSAQVEASSTLKHVSASLLAVNTEHIRDGQELKEAASYLFNAVSNVLKASVEIRAGNASVPEAEQSSVSHQLLSTVENLQSALLFGKAPGDEPTVLTSPSATMYMHRLRAENMDGTSINISNSSSASFTLPPASSLSVPGVDGETVDIRMVSFAMNPFFSSDSSSDISGTVGGLSLTGLDGLIIPVSNLKENIEIMLPRLSATQEDKILLNLGNYSTFQVNVTSENTSVVIHLESEHDIPLIFYLGYGYHPNETNYDMKNHLFYKKTSGGETNSWVLSREELIFGEGTYYFMVLQDTGMDSRVYNGLTINATCFASRCAFWDEHQGGWSSYGCHVSRAKQNNVSVTHFKASPHNHCHVVSDTIKQDHSKIYFEARCLSGIFSGFQVGPKTNPSSTQCLCNHLTFFGSSFFVIPNAIDVSKTTQLFGTFVDNPVVVTTVGCIFLIYVLVVIWARRKDIQDDAKVKITVLEDNDPFAQYRYLVTVFTGHRRGAATTSKVTLTLYGLDGESEPHHLNDPDTPVFERGGVDVFLLCTFFPLGELQSIRLWHDNSGDSPSWYVNRVLVHDLAWDQKWYFLCNSWLAIDIGECVLDKVFPVATEQDMKQFSNLFFMKTSKGFQDGHIWYSVFSRSPRSSFTRAQRVSCCFSLLLCTMLTSIMFWGVPKDPAEQKMDLGKIEFTWQEVMIGFESSLLMFPINLLIVQIFRNIRPRPAQPGREKPGKSGRVSPSLPPTPGATQAASLTPEAVTKDIRRIANSLSKALKAPSLTSAPDLEKSMNINTLLSLVEDIICQQNRAGQGFYDESRKDGPIIVTLGAMDIQEKTRSPTPENRTCDQLKYSDYHRCLYKQLQQVEMELELLGPHKFQMPQSYTQAVCQVQHMKNLLENQICSSTSITERWSHTPNLPSDDKKNSSPRGLPWWFVFIAWFLVAATSGVSGFFTMLYGLHYGKENSIKWLISMVISFLESLFITQPLKVLGFAAFFALVLKNVEHEDEENTAIDGSLSAPGDSHPLFGVRRDSRSNIYRPPPAADVEKMKISCMKEQKAFALIREILAYLGFLWMLLLVAYGQRDPNSYYLNKHIKDSFTDGFHDVYSYQDFFTWANTTLLKNLYGSYKGFITDGNSKLVGSARIRQVRVKGDSCPISPRLQHIVEECHAPYSLQTEDTSIYGEHWNTSVFDNSSDLSSAWQYQSQSKLRGHPSWGKLAIYSGGGYVIHLGTDPINASRILQYLFNNIWLDTFTRAVFVEFTVYNANVNLFCIISLMFESNALGAFFTSAELQSVRLYPYTNSLHIFVVAAEVIYFLFIVYYMIVQGKLLKSLRWRYFHSKWNLLEMAIILISWSALSVFVKRTVLGTRDISYYQEHKEDSISFSETARADAVLGYLIAFLVLLSTVKLWHLLRLNPKLNMITSTLRRAWGDISGFITVIAIMFLAYSIAANLIFGWKLYSYKTLSDSAETMVSLQLGIFNYEEVLDYNPILGSFLIGSCIIFMTFVVLNLFISVILVAFSEEQKYYQASEEEEIVDLMVMKLFSFFGIKCKKEEKPATGEQLEQPVSE
ncbi:polycystic kidney disease protein 1-like 2 [Cyanistes caeruleus]|uniref:polycystic kidney disease protein 1-like 2 n=1 Tax=Cyanistes caeruleus TaxID=156563 RepID=UPI000CDA1678|nr:polycystic kidney disease protein 1-like 2 [Cyanistes caeruleus]